MGTHVKNAGPQESYIKVTVGKPLDHRSMLSNNLRTLDLHNISDKDIETIYVRPKNITLI